MVIRLAIPSFAPGANAKGNGMLLSTKLKTTACAANNAIYTSYRFRVIDTSPYLGEIS